jgi:single-strand DNA-binding protein
MNKVILLGRLTRDPDVRYTSGENSTAVARYTLAVDRRFRREGDSATADFIGCVAFGRQAEFAEKYLRQGTKIAITGRIQTGSYTNREGQKVYTTDVVVEEQEFVESKGASAYRPPKRKTEPETDDDGFMNIPEGVEDEIPFR